MTERETDPDDFRDYQREWDGTCTYCSHPRDQHRSNKKPWEHGCTIALPGLICRCPYTKETP